MDSFDIIEDEEFRSGHLVRMFDLWIKDDGQHKNTKLIIYTSPQYWNIYCFSTLCVCPVTNIEKIYLFLF